MYSYWITRIDLGFEGESRDDMVCTSRSRNGVMALDQISESDRLLELRLVPDEKFHLGITPSGTISSYPPDSVDALLLTSHRIIRVGRKGGRRISEAAPLLRLDAAEVCHVDRSLQRLNLSVLLVVVGVALSVITWVSLANQLLALLGGGVVAVIGLWLLAGYLLAETESYLCFYANSHKITLPLYGKHSMQGACQVIDRFFEIVAAFYSVPDFRRLAGNPVPSHCEGKAFEEQSSSIVFEVSQSPELIDQDTSPGSTELE
jgi:hypothetical protein